ncbi:MAG TPA: SDR family NAD(P)-dependent oxidoreductase, partial [Candidatus Omnitrophota bacterium]|nr:SDR family NAD(P)-dependent oxidoreductase [Candidatus Omnitrophota bacterium]
MRKKEICLVTGGAGFIGSNLAEGLLRRGFRVRVLDNLSTGKRENLAHMLSRIEFIKGDIRDERKLRQALHGVSYVFHLAAIASVPESVAEPRKTHDINVTATSRLLEASLKAKVKRFVFTSSSSVYGETDKFPSTEEDLPRPESPYAASKVMGEYYCRNFSKLYGLETVSLRYFNVFGPRQNPRSRYANVIPIFLKKILDHEPPEVHWDGKQSRDFVYVDDVVAANLLAMKRPGIAGEAFNIGSHSEARVIDCLRGIQQVLGVKKVKVRHTPKRAGDV